MIKLNEISRRSFIRKGWEMLLSLLGLGILTGGYSFLGERFWYQVREVELSIPNLPSSFKGWRIVQFSDVHLGFHYDSNNLRRVVHLMNQLQPDMVFFTGDLIQVGYSPPESAATTLQQIIAPRGGKWAVLGNHDYHPKEKVVRTLLDAGFQVLENRTDYVEYQGQRLFIAGVGDVLNAVVDIDKTLQGLTDKHCVLLLAHEPDLANYSWKFPVSAQFSGHSHGGQVQIPFYGPIILHKWAKDYVDGLFFVGEKKMPLYVNRGIGTTQIPVRFSCRPEITCFYLR